MQRFGILEKQLLKNNVNIESLKLETHLKKCHKLEKWENFLFRYFVANYHHVHAGLVHNCQSCKDSQFSNNYSMSVVTKCDKIIAKNLHCSLFFLWYLLFSGILPPHIPFKIEQPKQEAIVWLWLHIPIWRIGITINVIEHNLAMLLNM